MTPTPDRVRQLLDESVRRVYAARLEELARTWPRYFESPGSDSLADHVVRIEMDLQSLEGIAARRGIALPDRDREFAVPPSPDMPPPKPDWIPRGRACRDRRVHGGEYQTMHHLAVRAGLAMRDVSQMENGFADPTRLEQFWEAN